MNEIPPLIVVASNYDLLTSELLGYARKFVSDAIKQGRQVIALWPPDACDHAHIQAVLAEYPRSPLFFFGHGREGKPGLYAQDQVPFIDAASFHLLKGRLLYATACHSLYEIQEASRVHGATILGYWGKLKVPVGALAADHSSETLYCLEQGWLALLGGRTLGQAQALVETAFRGLARGLHSHNDTAIKILSAAMGGNAKACGVLGDAELTL